MSFFPVGKIHHRMYFIWAHEKAFTVGTVILAVANKSEKF